MHHLCPTPRAPSAQMGLQVLGPDVVLTSIPWRYVLLCADGTHRTVHALQLSVVVLHTLVHLLQVVRHGVDHVGHRAGRQQRAVHVHFAHDNPCGSLQRWRRRKSREETSMVGECHECPVLSTACLPSQVHLLDFAVLAKQLDQLRLAPITSAATMQHACSGALLQPVQLRYRPLRPAQRRRRWWHGQRLPVPHHQRHEPSTPIGAAVLPVTAMNGYS